MDQLRPDRSLNYVIDAEPKVLIEAFKFHLEREPNHVVFDWVDYDEPEKSEKLTYRQLWDKATALAAVLQQRGLAGKNILLLFAFEGLHYLVAFWACILARAVAVPTYPPDPAHLRTSLGRLALILNDCECSLILTTSRLRAAMGKALALFPALQKFPVFAVDEVDPNEKSKFVETESKPEDVAFLQYTSGSTGAPKGVVVTQRNIMFNLYAILTNFRLPLHVEAAGWIPLYHDMGLIGFVIFPVFGAAHMHLMSPVSFLKRPSRWLQLIHDTRSYITGGPNFSYDLCVDRIPDDQLSAYDLSCCKLAFTGSEPVRPATLRRFLAKFSKCGFPSTSFMPVYGMAEATLLCSGHIRNTEPVFTSFKAEDLEALRVVEATPEDIKNGVAVRELTSNGQSTSGPHPFIIVNPTTLEECKGNEVGEIWLSGPTVTAGYYKKPEISAQTFGGEVSTHPGIKFLRTGDLGFIYKGCVYVCGRQKDLIIINGRNHYPQDIEHTVERHPQIAEGTCAAFSIEKNKQELLIIVAEPSESFDAEHKEKTLDEVRERIVQEHELQPFAIVLIRPGTAAKTASNKIQRKATMAAFVQNKLERVAFWSLESGHESLVPKPTSVPSEAKDKAKSIPKNIGGPMSEGATKLAAFIAGVIKKQAELSGRGKDIEIKYDVPFSSYGMSSPDVIGLTGRLEEVLGKKLSPTMFYEYPTIELISRFLAGEDMSAFKAAQEESSNEDDSKNSGKCSACSEEPLAIVGIGCRFPGASSPSEFWNLLCNGVDASSEIPKSRFDVDKYFDENPGTAGKMYVRRGSFISDVDLFDAGFFGISKSEASTMDPQQRILLTCVQEAFDDAGVSAASLAGSRTAVIVGMSSNDYESIQLGKSASSAVDSPFLATGSARSIAANRISYQYDLQGPSVTLDSACSSSLVAVDIAARYIRAGLCDAAVVGASNLVLSPEPIVALCQSGFLSKDGRCKAFSDDADGFARGEGVAAIILKPLARAVAAGDRIYAVVRGTAVNQDGRSNGLTAPNPRAQEQLLRAACGAASIKPEDVQYVECHGTGTALGDPIEVGAVNRALCGKGRKENEQGLLIGSVKSNIGHLEGCAGLAGLVKLALSISHKQIPPSILCEGNLNKKIDFEHMPMLHVATSLQDWPKPHNKDNMMIGGVSSFGFGGTNAHAILTDVPKSAEKEQLPQEKGILVEPLLISAHTPAALRATADKYAKWLSSGKNVPELSDLCGALALRYSHCRHRAAFLGRTKEDIISSLRSFAVKTDNNTSGNASDGVVSGKTLGGSRKVCFVFSGQGPQWYAMGRELLLGDDRFRKYFESLGACFAGLPLDWNIKEELSRPSEQGSLLGETKCAQVLLFILQVSIARYLRDLGVPCDSVLGHSLGECSAACFAGILDDKTAARLVFERSRLMQETTGKGKMCSLALTPEEAAPFVDKFAGRVSLSCYNGPRHVVIAGDTESLSKCIDAVKEAFPQRHIQYLPVNYVFHSPQLDFAVPLLSKSLQSFYSIQNNDQHSPVSFYSTVTGDAITPETLDPAYWGSQMRKPVRFEQAVSSALRDGHRVFVEISPRAVLSNYVRATADVHCPNEDVIVQPTLSKSHSDTLSIPAVFASLWTAGASVDPHKFFASESQSVLPVELPQRVWESSSYWVSHSSASESTPSCRKDACLYSQEWAALEEQSKSSPAALPQGLDRIVVFTDADDSSERLSIASLLTESLKTPSAQFLIVHRGSEFSAASDSECTASPEDPESIAKTLQHFGRFSAVVYCWANSHSSKSISLDWSAAITGVIHLTTAMSRHCSSLSLTAPLIIVSHNGAATPVVGEAIDPLQTSLNSLVLAAAAEYPNQTVVQRDISSADDIPALASEIRSLVCASNASEPLVALHAGHRYAPRTVRVSAPVPSSVWVDSTPIVSNATYVITGGLGGLGLEVTYWLAGKGAHHVLLADKFPASERATKRLAEIKSEYKDLEVEIVICDIEDGEAVNKMLSGREACPVRGIFHAAGILSRETFPQTKKETVDKCYSAKVAGAVRLHEASVSLKLDLDFFVVASSISSVLPHLGQGAYGSSNAFLNGLVAKRIAMKLPAFALQIGLLASVGMLAGIDRKLAARVEEEEGLYATPAADILSAMALAMSMHRTSILYARVAWNKYAPEIPMFAHVRTKKTSCLSCSRGSVQSAFVPVEDMEDEEENEEILTDSSIDMSSGVKSEDEIHDWISKNFAEALGIEVRELDPTAPLSNYGLQSVTVMDIANQLSSWLGIKVTPNLVYDYPTVDALAKHLAELVKKEIMKRKSSGQSGKRSKSKKNMNGGSAIPMSISNSGVIPGRAQEPIAVIGMACKFPGHCNTLDEFWDLLSNGRDAVTEIPADRFDWRLYYDPDIHKPASINSKWGGFVDDIDKFDADFWSISPREAERLDPQQRMCLELAWTALEDAGIVPSSIAGGKNGLFVGLSVSDYGQLELLDNNVADPYFATGSFICMNANRLSYLLDFQGPSVAMDTACSSSTVALHLACQALRNGEADICVAGGVNAILSPSGAMTLTKTGALSPEGHCFTFDARADGFVRSEGCGMVVLKPLSRALADGDLVYCAIDASAVNQDGKSQGLTAPNGRSQKRVYEDAFMRSGRSVDELAYVECHGTGTRLGDHIEVDSFGEFLMEHGRSVDDKVIVGSVKPNLGHLECASGMPSLMKVALSMQHNYIPPSILVENLNPHIQFDALPVSVSRGGAWPANKPKLAGISSFGFGGTNAHLLVEDIPADVVARANAARLSHVDSIASEIPETFLIAISARSVKSLRQAAARLAEFLKSEKGQQTPLRDVCYSLLCRREQHALREVFVAKNSKSNEKEARDDLVEQLETFAKSEKAGEKSPKPLSKPRIAFVFSGQGPQHFGMAKQLLADVPVFAKAIKEVDEEFAKLAQDGKKPFSVIEELNRPKEECHLGETVCAQRVLFAMQYALFCTYRTLGVKPSSVVGHSLGEIAAAVCAGLLDLPNAVKLIYHRSAIMNKATGLGKMLAVGLSQETVSAAISDIEGRDRVSFAALNGPKSSVLSGEAVALEKAAAAISAKHPEAFVKFMPVDYAFHSPQMHALADELAETVTKEGVVGCTGELDKQKPVMFSTLTGQKINSGAELTSEYWSEQVKKPVLFQVAIEKAMAERCGDVFVELAPHPVLAYYVKEIATAQGRVADCGQIASMRRDSADEVSAFWKSVGELHKWHTEGLCWNKVYAGGNYVRLPTYAWDKQRYWLKPATVANGPVVGQVGGIRPKNEEEEKDTIVTPILETSVAKVVDGDAASWVAHVVKPGPLEWEFDHKGFGSVLIPGVTYIEAALETSLRLHGPGLHVLSDIRFERPLFLGAATEARLYTSVVATTAYEDAVVVKSCIDETAEQKQWQCHARAIVHKSRDMYSGIVETFDTNADSIKARCPLILDGDVYYDGLWTRGLQLGPAFRSVKKIMIGEDEVLAEMHVPEHLKIQDYVFIPPVLDATMQCLGSILLKNAEGIHGIYLPYHMDRVMCWDKPPRDFYVHVIMKETNSRYILGDIHGFDKTGRTVLYISGFRCNYVEDSKGSSEVFYEQQWKQIESRVPTSPVVGSSRDVPCVIFADSTQKFSAGTVLARQMLDSGCTGVSFVYRREFAPEKLPEGAYVCDPTKESMIDVLQKCLSKDDGGKKIRVVYAWSLDCCDESQVQSRSLDPFISLVLAIQALSDFQTQLWAVTCGGRLAVVGERTDPWQGSLWGMAQIASQEYSQIKVFTADLPSRSVGIEEKHVANLAGQILANGCGEDQLCFRGDSITYGCRLAQSADVPSTRMIHTTLGETPCRLEITKAGNLDNLALVAVDRVAPAKGYVEVEIRAASLNFRDVMRAMGLYPAEEESPAVGLDAAGIVVRVGEGVTRFKPGDAVICVGTGAFGTHLTVEERFCVEKPEKWSFEEAASLIGVLMTAYVSLVWIARVKPGETVLVHSATGGVGLAALEICRANGCEVYATCGRPEKKKWLMEHAGIPEDHIFHSRTVAFADGIRKATNGRGVDVVLNSLMGEGLLRSFELLAPLGRFVEIGKRDIFANTPLGMRTFSRNVLVASVAVDEYFKKEPEFAHRLLEECVGHMAKGTFRPIPHIDYHLCDAVKGFRHMAATTQIGKIVMTMDPAQEVDVVVRAPSSLPKDGVYIVVGFGGLGLELSRWLLEHGAQRIVALTVFLSPEWSATADSFRTEAKTNFGADFSVRVCDITDSKALHSVFGEVVSEAASAGCRIRGIIHCAGLLDDQLLSAITPQSLARVLAPKVTGSWNLHQATIEHKLDLDFFVFFSSIASLMGQLGQASYASANAFIDTLCAQRRSMGLPAIALNWGPIRLGMTARLGKSAVSAMEAQGLTLLSRADFLEQLGKVILTPSRAELPNQLAVIKVDWEKWSAQNAGIQSKRFSLLVQSSGAQTVAGRQFLQQLFALAPPKRLDLVMDKLSANIASVLSLDKDTLDVNKPLNEMGLDSMVANEVRVKIEQEIGIPLSIASLIGGPPVSKLAKVILAQIDSMGDEAALAADGALTSLSIAVDLTPESADRSQIPIFAVCPAGGQAPIFLPLAAQLNRPFIALQRSSGACESIKELALAHAANVKKHCPNGPCILVGHSLGSAVAYEIVEELREVSYPVTALIMLDPINETARPDLNLVLHNAMVLCGIGKHAAEPEALVQALKDKSGQALWEAFFRACNVSPAERSGYKLAVRDIETEISMFARHIFTEPVGKVQYRFGMAVAGNNHPRTVQILKTNVSYDLWSGFIGADYSVCETVPGDHWTMLESPNVEKLAAVMKKMLA